MAWLKSLFRPPQPAGPPRPIAQFDSTRATLSESGASDEPGWHFDCGDSQTLRLFEVDPGEIENGMVTYRASLKGEDIGGRAYLEMWCAFPGQGEFFSRGFHNALKGSSDWASYEIPFYLKKRQRPNLLKLNLAVEGGGKLWIRDIELSFTPFK